MEKTLFENKLFEVLKKNPDFLSTEGEVLKDRVIDSAYKADRKLIELLLENTETKKKFFSEIQGHWVFNINDFVMFVQDKHFLNDSYTKYKNKIGLTIDGKFLNERKEVALVWPFKDTVLEGGMTKEDQKKKEIFFNEILAQDEIDKLLAPKVLTNWKRYTTKGEEEVKELKRDENGTIKENLIIKGNNLLALHTLKEQFRGKVKLIYIDPPYNTEGAANTFTYNNSFNHSSWLTFTKNRMDIAKQLLTQDGFFAIAIDHAEFFYVGVLGDEIFFFFFRVGVIAIETNPRGRSDSRFFATSHEYLIIFAKDITKAKINDLPLNEEQIAGFNLKDEISEYRLLPFRRSGSNSTPNERPNLNYPIYFNNKSGYIGLEKKEGCEKIDPIDTDGGARVWRQSKAAFLEALSQGDIVVKKSEKNGFTVYLKDRIKNGRKPKTFWSNPKYDASSHGTILLKDMLGEKLFSYPKSIYLMEDVIKILSNDNDIILDYHAGSGTTGHAVLNVNRQKGGGRNFILIEQMDYINTVTIPRLRYSMKDENMIFFELMKYNESFVEEIENTKDTKALLKIWEQMKEKAFFKHNFEMQKFEKDMEAFKKLDLEKQKQILFGVLDKNQLYVNYSEIEDKKFKVEKKEKEINIDFYGK